MTTFWEETSKSLASRLLSAGDAALLFWVWAVVAWIIANDGWSRFASATTPLLQDGAIAVLLAFVVVAVIVVLTSGSVVGFLTLPTLRLLEGYWPGTVDALRRRRSDHWRRKLDELNAKASAGTTSPEVRAELAVRMRRFPAPSDAMPTRIGNYIRAGEQRPVYWYGLDAVAVWPQFWLTLPEQARADLSRTREKLDTTVLSFNWAILSCALYWVWWPTLPLGVLVAFTIWRWWIPARASEYASTVGAVFDTHRFGLYDALHWPRPTAPSSEIRAGEALSQYLLNGVYDGWPVRYTSTSTKAS